MPRYSTAAIRRAGSRVLRAAGLTRRKNYDAIEGLLAEKTIRAAELESKIAALEKSGAAHVLQICELEKELADLSSVAAKLRANVHRFALWRATAAEIVVDIPELEFNLDTFNAGDAADGIRSYGCTILRGDDDTRARIQRYKDLLEVSGYTKLPVPRGGGLWTIQRTRFFKESLALSDIATNYEPTERLEFPLHQLVRERLFDLCCHILRSDIFMSTTGDTATVRTVKANGVGLVKFHQDISPVDLAACLTFWFCVDPDECGITAPGLKFVVPKNGKSKSLKTHHHTDAHGYHEISELQMSMDDIYWTPIIHPGDVVVFDPFAYHASFSTPDMQFPRTSVDLRVAPFEARRANSILDANQGLVLMNRDAMFGPVELLSAPPPIFRYGIFDGETEELQAAFDLARNTPFQQAAE